MTLIGGRAGLDRCGSVSRMNYVKFARLNPPVQPWTGGRLPRLAKPGGDNARVGMAEHATTDGIRFGRTVLDIVAGELAEQPVDAIIYPANSRGVMGAGPAGSLRSAAGSDIEREAMAHAPINLGGAIATSSGKLAERGIGVILHAVVTSSIGEHPTAPAVYRALDAAMKIAGEQKLRSIALPLLGVSAEDPEPERRSLAEGIVDVVVKRLRQRGIRLERVVFVVRFEDDRLMLRSVIQRARDRVWTTSA